MTGVLIGLASSAMLGVGLEIPWLAGTFISGIWDLTAIVGVVVSVGLLEGV